MEAIAQVQAATPAHSSAAVRRAGAPTSDTAEVEQVDSNVR